MTISFCCQSCDMFARTLLSRDRVSLGVFRSFLKVINEKNIQITNENVSDLWQLCDEFKCWNLSSRLSTFSNSSEHRIERLGFKECNQDGFRSKHASVSTVFHLGFLSRLEPSVRYNEGGSAIQYLFDRHNPVSRGQSEPLGRNVLSKNRSTVWPLTTIPPQRKIPDLSYNCLMFCFTIAVRLSPSYFATLNAFETSPFSSCWYYILVFRSTVSTINLPS
jgi:hypothetical protein